MARLIVKQPNGKLAIWSTVVASFIAINATKDDIINFYINRYKIELEERIKQLAIREEKTYDECLEWIEEVHDQKELKKIDRLLSKDKFMII